MLHVDIPTLPEIRTLVAKRADACVSIYVPTTPLTQDIAEARITLRNLAKEAFGQLRSKGFDKRRLARLETLIEDVAADDAHWRLQARSLAVLATPDQIQTFRLPSHLKPIVEVSDRFHLKPLLRAVTFPNEAFVLVLAEKKVRLIHVLPDLPGQEVKIKEMPKSAGDAVGRATVNVRSPRGRIQGMEGQEVLLRQFARKVDAALRPLLAGRTTPLILAAADPLGPIYRAVNTYPHLLEEGHKGNMERASADEIAEMARPILDAEYAREVAALKSEFDTRTQQGRATADVAQAARAATFGAIQTLLVDIDEVIEGTVDDETGAVTFATGSSADTYGIVDEIAARALMSGARVLGVRKADLPGGASLAAILRYPF